MKMQHKADVTNEDDGEMPEFEPGVLEELLRTAERGKYAKNAGTTIYRVSLEPDVHAAFPNDKAVNEALRSIMNGSGRSSGS